jgi:hypothetical protein
MPAAPKLHHTRSGETLCSAHNSTGAPAYHTPGCDRCAAARAKGIIRPDIDSVPKKLRGRRRHLEDHIDWDKVPREHRGALANAINARKMGF